VVDFPRAVGTGRRAAKWIRSGTANGIITRSDDPPPASSGGAADRGSYDRGKNRLSAADDPERPPAVGSMGSRHLPTAVRHLAYYDPSRALVGTGRLAGRRTWRSRPKRDLRRARPGGTWEPSQERLKRWLGSLPRPLARSRRTTCTDSATATPAAVGPAVAGGGVAVVRKADDTPRLASCRLRRCRAQRSI